MFLRRSVLRKNPRLLILDSQIFRNLKKIEETLISSPKFAQFRIKKHVLIFEISLTSEHNVIVGLLAFR